MLYDSLSPFQDNTGLFLMLSFLRFSLWPSLLSVPPLSHQLYSLSPAYRPLFSRSGKRVQSGRCNSSLQQLQLPAQLSDLPQCRLSFLELKENGLQLRAQYTLSPFLPLQLLVHPWSLRSDLQQQALFHRQTTSNMTCIRWQESLHYTHPYSLPDTPSQPCLRGSLCLLQQRIPSLPPATAS